MNSMHTICISMEKKPVIHAHIKDLQERKNPYDSMQESGHNEDEEDDKK